MALRRAVVRCGVGNWAEVSERVKGKSDSQCRERWTNSVDPRIVGYANWTREVSVSHFQSSVPRRLCAPTENLTVILFATRSLGGRDAPSTPRRGRTRVDRDFGTRLPRTPNRQFCEFLALSRARDSRAFKRDSRYGERLLTCVCIGTRCSVFAGIMTS